MDEATDRLIVGGTDMLFVLDMKTMKTTQTVEWISRDEVLCEARNIPKDKCRNYIRVLIPYEGDKIFVCGTHSYSPQCTLRDAQDLNLILRNITGVTYCPFSPDINSIVVMTSNMDAYSASVADPQERNPIIVKKGHDGHILITPKSNSYWLNAPSFVSAYEINEFVYFFFREAAVENINCGKVVFSRVARVCKNDKGIGTWTTFLKTRLNCSLPGEYPFYFDELQSTYYSEDKKLVYGVFTTPKNGMAGSAVCVYSLTSFQNAFESPFKFQEHYNSLWLAKPNNNSRQCEKTKRSPNDRRPPNKGPENHVLMDQAAMPKNNQPLIMKRNERWTQIAVDHLLSQGEHFDIIFLATEEGKVLKMMKNPRAEEACLIEELHVVPNKSDVIQNMKLSKAHNSLFIAIRENIIKIPLQRCERLSTKQICITAQDPYCGWHNKDKKCIPQPVNPEDYIHWEQKIEGCPDIKSRIHGGWSDWSEWTTCPYNGDDKHTESCLCRSRTCDKPVPINGGKYCHGHHIEIKDCKVNGAWTDWSPWSPCSRTCGWGEKTRTRICGEPAPQFGGKPCVGKDIDKQSCDSAPCPAIPIDGEWSEWAGWSTCTVNCNKGFQVRKRRCDKPKPNNGGRLCEGNNEQYRTCNTHVCTKKTNIGYWSDWFNTNRTKTGHFQQRFRFKCTAPVDNADDIKITFAESQAQFCPKKTNTCSSLDDKTSPTSLSARSDLDESLRRVCNRKTKSFKGFCNCRTLGVFLVCKKCDNI
ncbi:semaphorin-5A-like [Physella acuta]|uniref:semaphorin-5A-like n=1 Tax=Physella acuta TaxID=109671 RepID=UPI0027DC15D2|nr:semaphorin-5A-like [Physella acuta]